jgi:hypothetical protein
VTIKSGKEKQKATIAGFEARFAFGVLHALAACFVIPLMTTN